MGKRSGFLRLTNAIATSLSPTAMTLLYGSLADYLAASIPTRCLILLD